MKARIIPAIALIMLVMATIALAADLSGKWTAEVEGRNGKRTITFTLKAEGANLTGTMAGRQGSQNPIADGKVSGDVISFTVTVDTPNGRMTTAYTGELEGDDLKMRSQREGADRTQEFTAKRAQ